MIRAVVVGQEGVIAHLREVEPRVRGLLGQAVRAETINLVREAKIKVSGPVLRTRTDHLRTGINPQFEETETSITGSAGINSGKAKYPAVHEYGGTFTIRAHVRRLTQVFGRLLKSVLQVAVRAHSATFPERSYLRSSLRENEDRIKAALAAAVAKGVQG
jgi:hypothetical protein